MARKKEVRGVRVGDVLVWWFHGRPGGILVDHFEPGPDGWAVGIVILPSPVWPDGRSLVLSIDGLSHLAGTWHRDGRKLPPINRRATWVRRPG